jgi:hypothetical protein
MKRKSFAFVIVAFLTAWPASLFAGGSTGSPVAAETIEIGGAPDADNDGEMDGHLSVETVTDEHGAEGTMVITATSANLYTPQRPATEGFTETGGGDQEYSRVNSEWPLVSEDRSAVASGTSGTGGGGGQGGEGATLP